MVQKNILGLWNELPSMCLIKQRECSSVFTVHTWYKNPSFIARSILKNVQDNALYFLKKKHFNGNVRFVLQPYFYTFSCNKTDCCELDDNLISFTTTRRTRFIS